MISRNTIQSIKLRMYLKVHLGLVLGLLFVGLSSADVYNVGIGIADVTGPAAEIGMVSPKKWDLDYDSLLLPPEQIRKLY